MSETTSNNFSAEGVLSKTKTEKGGKTMKTYIFNAADGNPTAIIVGPDLKREDYARINDDIQSKFPEVEQVGFYEEENGVPRLQMAGGEFCGNATRSFACLLKEFNADLDVFYFNVSGYEGRVEAQVVEETEPGEYFCEARLGKMPCRIVDKYCRGVEFSIVDLGGITHIIVSEDEYLFDPDSYESEVKRIKQDLGVDNDAVGVLWVTESEGNIYMKPVVWVKEIDTCYYETSCGSGSIAVAMKRGKYSDIVQPSGSSIKVELTGDSLFLSSVVKKTKEVVYERD